MKSILTKELRVYFASASGYLVIAGLPLFASVWFLVLSGFFEAGIASLRGFYGILPFALVVTLPALSMRMWAEERREGTDELLLSLPVSDLSFVAAKLFAAVVVVLIALGLTLIVPMTLVGYGTFERGEGVVRYVGLALLALSILSLGQVFSLLARNQIVAYVLSLTASLVLTLAGSTSATGTTQDVLRFLSFDSRYRDFARGLISTDDAAFFLGLSAILVVGCLVILDRRRGRGLPRERRITRSLLLLLLVLAVGNAQVFRLRIDTTRDRLHTLAPATRELLVSLPDQVQVTYAISDRLQDRFTQPGQIVDLLLEYESASRGSLRLSLVDPVNSERTEEFQSRGVIGQQLEIAEAGEQTLALVYSGLVIEYLDRATVLPFVFSADTLEYDLTRALRDLIRDDVDRAVVIDTDPGNPAPPENRHGLLLARVSTGFEAQIVQPSDPLSDDVAVVIVPGAERLSRSSAARIAAYLSRGGAALLLADSVDVSIADGLSSSPVSGSAVAELAAEYGIQLGDQLILDVNAGQIPVEEVSGGFRLTRLYPYPFWIEAQSAYSSADHPVTRRFPGMTVFWPTWLEVSESGPAQIISATSPEARRSTDPPLLGPLESRDAFVSAGEIGQYGLIAVSTPDGGGSRLAVVSDGDLLDDELIVASGAQANLEIAMSLAEWLTANDDILAIRTRSLRDATLTPEQALLSPLGVVAVNVVLAPLAVAVIGMVRVRRRRSSGATEGSDVA